MLKLLIADDEPFIRQGIRSTVPWEAHGIQVVGEAGNGREALRLAARLRPDIVLADIQMPMMDGLELARQLQEILPGTAVIILSAHGNTQNFTGAIEAKVSRFLLKNADSSQLLSSVLEVADELTQNRDEAAAYERMQSVYNENQYMIRSSLVKRLLENQISAESFLTRAQRVRLETPGPFYALLLAECVKNAGWNTPQAFQTALRAYKPFVFFMEDGLLAALMNTGPEGLSLPELRALLPEMKPYILGNRVAVMAGIELIETLPVSYAQLDGALDFCFWNPQEECVLLTPDDKPFSRTGQSPFELESKMISAVLSRDLEAIDDSIGRYYEFCHSQVISRTVFWDSVKRLLVLLSSILHLEQETGALVQTMFELETPREVLELLCSLTRPQGQKDAKNPQIREALDYIDKNYQKPLRLEDVGRQVALSTGYLSRIFKSETGCSFTEWLNRVRIEKAKELITSTDLKYYEVAEWVGYRDYKYFSAYFNKFTGCSAKEYKQRSGREPLEARPGAPESQ